MKKNFLAASLAAILFFQTIAPTVLLAKTTGEIDSVTKIESIEQEDIESSLRQLTALSGKPSSVQKRIDSDGNVLFYVKEGDMENILEIKQNGDMYIDGAPIYVETYKDGQLIRKDPVNANRTFDDLNISDSLIQSDLDMLRSHGRRIMKSLPSGVTDADLPDFLGNYTKVVTFGNSLIKDITVSVFCEIVGTALLGGIGGVVITIYQNIYNAAKKQYPKNNALSCKYAKRSGNNVGGYLYIEKVYTEFYGTKQFTGYLGNSIGYVGYYG